MSDNNICIGTHFCGAFSLHTSFGLPKKMLRVFQRILTLDAQAFGVVAAENKFERTGGLSAWARGYSGVDANLRNSFIDNEVLEGNHVWNYNTVRPRVA